MTFSTFNQLFGAVDTTVQGYYNMTGFMMAYLNPE